MITDVRVVVAAGATADGAAASGSVPVRGPAGRDHLDRLRAAADAVAVDVETVHAADPALVVAEEDRRVQRLRNGRPGSPPRLVADPLARTPPDARVLDDAAPTHVLVSPEAPSGRREVLTEREQESDGLERQAGSQSAGVEIREVDGDENGVDPGAVLTTADDLDASTLLVEGHGPLPASLFEAGLVDEFSLFLGHRVVGGDAPRPVAGADIDVSLALGDVERLDEGVVLTYDVA